MCMEKDDKVEKLIAPFKDSAISHLSYERVMLTIDAIVERRNEILKNELSAIIQKLQIESTFPPEISDPEPVEDEVDEKEEMKDFEFKRSIADLLTKKFVSELNTLTDSEYYNDVKWFITLPSYNTNSLYDYCRALKYKVEILINSVNNDPNSNAFYIARRKVDTNTIIPTMLLFDPKVFTVSRVSPFECNEFSNDNIKLTITDCNGDNNSLKLKYHHGYSIIECDNGNPNFMLFDPVNCEYVLFYKSHKLLNASCDVRNVKDVDENVKSKDEILEKGGVRYNMTKVWGELCHPEDISDPYRKPKVPILYSVAEVKEDKRTKTRNKLKELFGGVIMTITNEREVNENFTYSNSNLQTLKKNIRKYIRNLICTIPESEPLYIYSNKNKHIEKPITCYNTRNYKIIPSSTSNNPWFNINISCETYDISIPILFFDKSTYFLSVRNKDPENKSYNFAIVNAKTKEFVIFTKDKFVFDGWKLEITAER